MASVPAEPPFDVPALLARERGALMASLQRLRDRDWERRAPWSGWTVRDVVSHLWGADLLLLSRLRDGHVVDPVDGHADRWAEATRDLSPRVLLDRLQESGPQVTTVLRMGDPTAPAERVAWAGDDVKPLWFCGARELAGRFVHQQQVRAAVGQLPFDDEDVLAAVVDTIAYAFPATLATAPAPPGTSVTVVVTGAVPRRWTFTAGARGWRPDPGGGDEPSALLRTDADGLWRLLAGVMTPAEQVQRVELRGTPSLFAVLRDTRAAVVRVPTLGDR